MDWFVRWEQFMRTDLGLKGSELYIYAVIYGFSKQKKTFSGSLKYLSEVTGFTAVQSCNALKNLVNKGYIIKNAINARRIEYTALMPEELTAKGLIRQTKEKAVTSPPENSSISENIENNTTMKTENELRKEHDRVYQKVLEKANQK